MCRIIGCSVVLFRCVRSSEDGKKLLDSGKGIQTEYGLLFVNREIKFEDFYNGTTFSGYFCDPDAIANVGIFYRGITKYVELPCEDIAIKKAICKLGAENIKACKLEADSRRDLTDEWLTKIRSVENTKDTDTASFHCWQCIYEGLP